MEVLELLIEFLVPNLNFNPVMGSIDWLMGLAVALD